MFMVANVSCRRKLHVDGYSHLEISLQEEKHAPSMDIDLLSTVDQNNRLLE